MGANQMESKVFNATFCSVSFKIQSIVDPQLSVRMCVPKFENPGFKATLQSSSKGIAAFPDACCGGGFVFLTFDLCNCM